MIPVFDTTALAKLVEDLDLYVAMDFLTTFSALLAGRIERIEQAYQDHDEEEITTALLSLQASAAMVGAAQLEASATRALGQQPTRAKHSGALIRRLEGQADVFRETIATLPIAAVPATYEATG
ncbi:hypothetical protein ACX80U_01900 [Arthrobacter sp. TmT3-37]